MEIWKAILLLENLFLGGKYLKSLASDSVKYQTRLWFIQRIADIWWNWLNEALAQEKAFKIGFSKCKLSMTPAMALVLAGWRLRWCATSKPSFTFCRTKFLPGGLHPMLSNKWMKWSTYVGLLFIKIFVITITINNSDNWSNDIFGGKYRSSKMQKKTSLWT